ncbi:hypothetical protein EMIHUDRAFT_456468 [Emiliania huxleyi CCMP1516]|uniref:Vesicle-fusing ATPase n=2 Tax=Emiliania huxleyi TaxID=2903 RepID=A0A0D3K4K1_EMIH1|nr:hypothetical protein EMIHUDRAFT_456468 [Emiliania huxleyi CCMP1516]EOD30686.1 hypothetical protein EMIHUDRAFT_456468 [Emiliania huxleyi CCMP1516]|eukprot:XP_005783115.1 hypothetical protein EMIHUDRAFT_456468 [Emiliania huxleyi CCMP1516]
MPQMRVSNSPNQECALTNCAFLSDADHSLLGPGGDVYVEMGGYVLTARADRRVEPGCVALNSIHRGMLSVSNGASIAVDVFSPSAAEKAGAAMVVFEVDYVLRQRGSGREIDAGELSKAFLARFALQYVTVNQPVVAEWQGDNLKLTATSLEVIPLGQDTAKGARRGMLGPQTQLQLRPAAQSPIKLTGAAVEEAAKTNIFRSDWSFEAMGIGGLDQEFSDIFRRAFASRIFPVSPRVWTGMMLHGPPGTGKTLIARQIGKMLNGKEPKVVNGPEVLSKFVGQAEENVRKLFAEAEAEYESRGDDSDLHIIIFDEIDSICKQRGMQRSDAGVGDTVVNQLLSKIDGVHSLNNILVIGMTNRLDMIDAALLRPGRLEVQVEISLPDEHGRHQILSIHTAKMRENKYLSPDVSLEELAAETKNFSGAEIEGLVRSATSWAFGREVTVENVKKGAKAENLLVTRPDFDRALAGPPPCSRILEYGGSLPRLKETMSVLIQQLRASSRTSLLSVVFEGAAGAGKTALAAHMALTSTFPFRVATPCALRLGVHEAAKAAQIKSVFDDAHRSELSVVILDDLERLLDYARIGPRFSNVVLQTLLTCIKQPPKKKGGKLLVLESLELLDAFNVKLSVEPLDAPSVLRALGQLGVTNAAELQPILGSLATGVPIKKLLLVLEMAMTADRRVDPARFTETLQHAGILG